MKRIVAVVPARGGSKRLPGKNTRLLGGVPLLAHTLRSAQTSGCFSRVLVSTDDETIAAVARSHGGDVPWLRSAENAGDTSGSVDVVLEALDRLAGEPGGVPDAVALLQPTSPFRSVDTIRRGVSLFESGAGESVVSVSPAADHPWWCRTVNAQGEMRPFFPGAVPGARSQDLPPVYVLNGVLYIASVATLRDRRSFESPRTRALVLDSPEEVLDIDTPFDWMVAEAVCLHRGRPTP